MYALIGSLVVKTGIRLPACRYSRQIRIGVGVATLVIGAAAAYLASSRRPRGLTDPQDPLRLMVDL